MQRQSTMTLVGRSALLSATNHQLCNNSCRMMASSRSPGLTAASMMAAQILAMKNKKQQQQVPHHTAFPDTLHNPDTQSPTTEKGKGVRSTPHGRGGRRRHNTNSTPHTKGNNTSSSVVVDHAPHHQNGNNTTATATSKEYTVMDPFEGHALAMDPPGTQVPNERAVLDIYEGMMETYARTHTKWRVAMKKHQRLVDDILAQEEAVERAAATAAASSLATASSTGGGRPSDIPIGTVEVDAADLFDLMGDDTDDTLVKGGDSATAMSEDVVKEDDVGLAAADRDVDVDASSSEAASTRPPLPTPPVEPLPPTIPPTVSYNCRGCGTTLFVGTISVNNRPVNGAPFVSIKESNTTDPSDVKASPQSSSSHKSAEDGLLEAMTKMKVPYPQFRCSVGDKAVFIGAQSVEVEYATIDDLAKEESSTEESGGDETLPLHTLERFDISKRIKNAEESMEKSMKRTKIVPFMPLAELKREYNTSTLTHAEELRNKRLFKAAARQDRFLSSMGRAQRYPGMCACCNRVVCVVTSSSKGGLIVNPTSVECQPSSPTQK